MEIDLPQLLELVLHQLKHGTPLDNCILFNVLVLIIKCSSFVPLTLRTLHFIQIVLIRS